MAALAIVLVTQAGGGAAQPLDQARCTELQAERDRLVAAGAEADMARGPEWARANLAPDRLLAIARLIDVDEQLGFRCGLAKERVNLPPTIDGGEELLPPEPGEEGAAAKPGAAPGAQPAAQAPRPPARAPETDRHAAPAPGTQPAVAPPAKGAARPPVAPATGDAAPRPRPRPAAPAAKVDDAYRPPPRPPSQ